jgi:uncharacterized protein (TIGR00297 family)
MLQRALAATSISSLVALYALKKRKLTPSASAVAFVVGTIIGLAGASPDAALLTFFLTASKITSFGKDRKMAMSEKGTYDAAGNRNVKQVLSNSAAAVAVILFDLYLRRGQEALPFPSSLACRLAVTHHFAGTNGDTFSSEIGVLSKSKPRLILNPFRQVPAGTNGGVTLLGIGAAAVGGALVGLASFGAEKFLANGIELSDADLAKKFILGSVVAAIGCSVLDSVLGMLFQYSGESAEGHQRQNENGDHDSIVVVTENSKKSRRQIAGFLNLLDNDTVNLVSAFVVTALSYYVFSM